MILNDDELLRYSGHLMLPELDLAGQERLSQARVLIAGLGGLGSPAALYLAAAGVGELHLADDDQVSVSNLQRQILYGDGDIDRDKAALAAERLQRRHRRLTVHGLKARLSAANLPQHLQAVDVVLDCTDNFATRFALNAAAVAAGIPLVSGAAIRWQGQLAVFDPRRDDSPCYRCLFSPEGEEMLPCSESGIAGPLVGIIGAWQALEAIKLLAGAGQPLIGQLLTIDALSGRIKTLHLAPDPACPVCGKEADIKNNDG